MVSGAVFCPHPPALVPVVAQGAATELDDLRAACRAAIERVATPGRPIIVIGSGPVSRTYATNARGSLAGFGVDLDIPLGSAEPDEIGRPPSLPLSLTIGAWLLRDALGPGHGAVGAVTAPGELPTVPDDVTSAASAAERSPMLLVMGDGSARRGPSAPGYLDERAAPFDAEVAAALGSGDPQRLLIDAELGGELLAAGPPAWRTAAGCLAGASYDAEVLYDAAPHGVGYFVAAWARRA